MVAGGSGRRFGGAKQFLELAGRPVVAWSIEAARPVSDGIVVVVPSHSPAGNAVADLGADQVVIGGHSRAESVRAGLAAVPSDAAIIVVHDAARPLAPTALFAAVVASVRSGVADGAIPVLPVSDTLKRTDGPTVVGTIDRDGLVVTQTPQAFAAPVLRRAHATGDEATDDAGLVERLGARVDTVEGDPHNVKLTRPEDLALAEALLRSGVR